MRTHKCFVYQSWEMTCGTIVPMWVKDELLKVTQKLVARTHYRLVTGRLADAELLVDLFTRFSSGIVHVGGHHAQEAHWYASLGKPVVWVEAMPSAVARMEEVIAEYPDQRVLQACVSSVDGQEVTFHVSANNDGASSSLFDFGSASSGATSMWPDVDLRMIEDLHLQTITLDSLFDQHNIPLAHLDHWIIDVQGAELLVLMGGVSSLAYCRSILVESSSIDVYSGGAKWHEVRDFLEQHGFVPLWECLGHMDVLFVRRDQSWLRPLG